MVMVPSRAANLVALLRDRALEQAESRAFVFLRDGESEDAILTFAALDEQARSIGAELQRSGLRSGDRAILAYPAGLDFIAAFFGCLYAGVIAVPVQPPTGGKHARGVDRLLAITADADPAALLTTRSLQLRSDEWLPARVGRVATDVLVNLAQDYRAPMIRPEHIALLQYTSGSTSAPRGVMVTHENVIANLAAAFALSSARDASMSVSWLPATHDMGLIEGVLQPIFRGHGAALMSPAAFLARPIRWLAAIARYRAARSGGPNFAYDLCARRVSSDAATALDLSCWRDADCGAEPVRAETLTAFTSAFRRSGFRPDSLRPSYGLAEATLLVAAGRWREGGEDNIAYDEIANDTRFAIVDPRTRRPCADTQVGEIWVAGPGVAAGYWRQPTLTRETFTARTADGAGPFLRTGDLGSRTGGVLRVAGRLKDVLIVRGQKHFPQDLERAAATAHAAIRSGAQAAFAIEADGADGDRVAIVVEVDPRRRGDNDAGIVDAIRLAVGEHCGVQLHGVALAAPGVVPMTPSGKVQRSRARAWWDTGCAGALTVWTTDRQLSLAVSA